MRVRFVLRTAGVAVLTAGLVLVATPPTAQGEWGGAPALPPCPTATPGHPAADQPPGAVPPEGVPPEGVPPEVWAASPGPLAPPGAAACRAVPTSVEAAAAGVPTPRPGYHHLGATTVEPAWSGLFGRLSVRDTGVRRGTYDFVATRLMAKRATGPGRVAWLEVGWAETGWSGGGAQRLYTFDTNAMSWVFYDQYDIGDGDEIWVYLHTDTDAPRPQWQAWLWWDGRWHLLTAQELPLTGRAQLEQYVEVHVDHGPADWPGGRIAGPRARPRPRAIAVPPIRVDQVRVKTAPDGVLRPWSAGAVATTGPGAPDTYCLVWHRAYDAWSAGDCAATVQE